jgi:hypothetical protein
MMAFEVSINRALSAGPGRTLLSTSSWISESKLCQVFVDGASAGQSALLKIESIYSEAAQINATMGGDLWPELAIRLQPRSAHATKSYMRAESPCLSLEANCAQGRFYRLKKFSEVSFQAQPNHANIPPGKGAHTRNVRGKWRDLDFLKGICHPFHLFFRHISQELYGDMHQFRPNEPQTIRRDLSLQAPDLVAHLFREIYRYEASDSGHLSTAPLLADVTEFL